MFLYTDNSIGDYQFFSKDYTDYVIVIISIVQPSSADIHEYVKGSYRMNHDAINPSTLESVRVSLQTSQVIAFSSKLIFKNIKREREISILFEFRHLQ